MSIGLHGISSVGVLRNDNVYRNIVFWHYLRLAERGIAMAVIMHV